LEELECKGPKKVRNIWEKQDLGIVDNKLEFELEAHASIFVKLLN